MTKSSITLQIEEARVLIRNSSSHADIRHYLNALGYNQKHFQKGRSLLEQAVMLQEAQKEQYKACHLAHWNCTTEHNAIEKNFKEHFKLARMAYQDEVSIRNLKLYKSRESKIAKKLVQTLDFYTELLKNPKPMAKYNVDTAQIEQAKAAVEALIDMRDQRVETLGEAENATQKRNAALKALRAWVRDYKAILRVALQDEPQLLEVVGIKITSHA